MEAKSKPEAMQAFLNLVFLQSLKIWSHRIIVVVGHIFLLIIALSSNSRAIRREYTTTQARLRLSAIYVKRYASLDVGSHRMPPLTFVASDYFPGMIIYSLHPSIFKVSFSLGKYFLHHSNFHTV